MQRFKTLIFGHILDTYIRHNSRSGKYYGRYLERLFYQNFIYKLVEILSQYKLSHVVVKTKSLFNLVFFTSIRSSNADVNVPQIVDAYIYHSRGLHETI